MNLRLYLFVSNVIEKNDGERRVQDFFALPKGISRASCIFSVCGVFVDD